MTPHPRKRFAYQSSTRQRQACFVWAICILVSAMAVLALPSYAQKAKDPAHKERIEALESQSQSLESKARDARQKKQKLLQKAKLHSQNLLKNQIKLDQRRRDLYFYQKSRETTASRINLLDSKIDQVYGDAARLTQDAAKRIKSLYMGERVSMLQMVLEANDISTMLDRLYYKQRVVAQDKKLLTDLNTKLGDLQILKEELHRQKIVMDSTIRTIQVNNMQIQRLIDVDKGLRDKYRNDAAFYERAERQLLAQSKQIERELAGLSSAKIDKVQVTGRMMWPMRGPITSGFGYRVHPIHRKRLNHTGLDIAGPNGAAVKAADGGQVIFAGWKGGYGKAVMINHGNNLVTLYGHMSAIYVSNGQYVTKGQAVGAEGSTGYSTGPHLHFEVRVKGVPVNPMNYL